MNNKQKAQLLLERLAVEGPDADPLIDSIVSVVEEYLNKAAENGPSSEALKEGWDGKHEPRGPVPQQHQARKLAPEGRLTEYPDDPEGGDKLHRTQKGQTVAFWDADSKGLHTLDLCTPFGLRLSASAHQTDTELVIDLSFVLSKEVTLVDLTTGVAAVAGIAQGITPILMLPLEAELVKKGFEASNAGYLIDFSSRNLDDTASCIAEVSAISVGYVGAAN